jgi:hypothetical protein
MAGVEAVAAGHAWPDGRADRGFQGNDLRYRRTAYVEKHRRLGLCDRCPQPATHKTLCDGCFERQRVRDSRRRHAKRSRVQKRRWALRFVKRRLAGIGCQLADVDGNGHFHVVRPDGSVLTVGVRAAWPTVAPVQSATGKRYNYAEAKWNLHERGVLVETPDCWVLVRCDDQDQTLVLSASVVSGRKTVGVQVGIAPNRQRSSLYRYVGRCDLIRERCVQLPVVAVWPWLLCGRCRKPLISCPQCSRLTCRTRGCPGPRTLTPCDHHQETGKEWGGSISETNCRVIRGFAGFPRSWRSQSRT